MNTQCVQNYYASMGFQTNQQVVQQLQKNTAAQAQLTAPSAQPRHKKTLESMHEEVEKKTIKISDQLGAFPNHGGHQALKYPQGAHLKSAPFYPGQKQQPQPLHSQRSEPGKQDTLHSDRSQPPQNIVQVNVNIGKVQMVQK